MNVPGRIDSSWRTAWSWQKALRWMGALITAASVVYLFRALKLHAGALPENWVARYGSVWLGVSVLLFLASVTCGFLIWRWLLSSEQIGISVMASANVYLVSQIGKYIPGNIAQHFGWVVLAGRHGIPIATTTRFIVIEVIAVVTAAVSFVAVICLFQPD